MSHRDLRSLPLVILALLVCVCAVVVYRAPVRRYVVACERTTRATCVLEQTESSGVRRWTIPLGVEDSAFVRLMLQRRGAARVLLYLTSPAGPVFAAEFEGGDARPEAHRAAAQLNEVLRHSAPAARVEVVPPPIFRWMAWAGLGVTALLIVAAYRQVRSRGDGISSHTLTSKPRTQLTDCAARGPRR